MVRPPNERESSTLSLARSRAPAARRPAMLFFGRGIDPDPTGLRAFRVALTAARRSLVVVAASAGPAWHLPGHRFQQRRTVWFAGGEWGLLLDFLSTD